MQLLHHIVTPCNAVVTPYNAKLCILLTPPVRLLVSSSHLDTESEGSEEGFDERGGGGSKDDMSPASRRGRYLPPHQRARQPGADQRERQQKLERLRRRMQGLINRSVDRPASCARVMPLGNEAGL